MSEANHVTASVCAGIMSILSVGQLLLSTQTRPEFIEAKRMPVHLSMVQMSNKSDGWGEASNANNIEVLSSDDGGASWNLVATVSSYEPIQFGTSGAAWYATKDGNNPFYARIHFTKDWGRHWSVSNSLSLPSGHSDNLQLSFAAGQRVGWMTVSAGGMNTAETLQVWRTTDGGSKWRLVSDENPSDFLLGFQDSLTGWAECAHAGSPEAIALTSPRRSTSVYLQPALYRTLNGGRTWEPQYLPVPTNLIRHTGLASLSNMKWYGRDGFMAVSFTSDQLPYEKWGLYSTTDGGAHWSLHMVNGVSNIYGHHIDDIAFDVASPRDFWETVTQGSQASGGPYIAKSTTVYHSAGSGSQWKIVGKTPVPLSHVQFVSTRIGFGLTSTGHLYRTTDGGHEWLLVD